MIKGIEVAAKTLNNGVQVLALSDARFVKSSAALAVMAGSMQNPQNHLGLAHFLEHMLFLGTDEFPEVGEYEDYLNKNGGGHNAYTSIDHTNYFFDVAHPAFAGALRRFSRFFVCPTFDPKYVDREKNAVHSEHEKNRMEDSRREHRFLQLTTDPNHPFSRFATGDKDTLGKADRNVVMDFYRKNYSANLMRLVMMSPQPVDEIIKLAEEHFSDVENKKLPWPQYGDQLFSHLKEPVLHHVQTVRDQNVLKCSFAWPDDMDFWKSKPTSFIAHLLGEEGEGSLLSFLKAQNWATGLETSTWWRMFHVRIKLTDKGRAHVDDILRALFANIARIRQEGLKPYLFEERQRLAQIELDHLEPKSSMDRASHFSASLLYYPADEFLKRQYLYETFSPKDFNHFLSYLRPENMQVTLLTAQPLPESEEEAYYGIRHREQKIEARLLKELREAKPIAEITYPEPNPFVPDHLDLVMDKKLQKPQLEDLAPHIKLYSQTDTELGIPRASLSLTFISDQVKADPRRYLMAKLYARLKNEELNEWAYSARLAGLSYQFSFGYNSITLEVNGYSQHLVSFLKLLIEDKAHKRRLDEIHIENSVFERIREKFKKSLLNKEHDAAYQHLLYELSNTLTTSSLHRHDYLPFIDQVSLAEVQAFSKTFFSKVAIRGYGYGNLTGAALREVAETFTKSITAKGFTETQVETFENKFLLPPQGGQLFQFEGINNNNAQLTLYPFATWSIRDQAYVSMLSKVIEQPFFTELRTHQQLGYIVASFPSASYGFAGLATLIQSQSHGPKEIAQRSMHFMQQFLKDLPNRLTEHDVSAIRDSILAELSIRPTSLSERLARFTLMAGTYHGQFDFFERMIEETKAIQADDLRDYVVKSVLPAIGSNQPQQLSFLYKGQDTASETVELPGLQVVESRESFKKGCQRIQPYKVHK